MSRRILVGFAKFRLRYQLLSYPRSAHQGTFFFGNGSHLYHGSLCFLKQNRQCSFPTSAQRGRMQRGMADGQPFSIYHASKFCNPLCLAADMSGEVSKKILASLLHGGHMCAVDVPLCC